MQVTTQNTNKPSKINKVNFTQEWQATISSSGVYYILVVIANIAHKHTRKPKIKKKKKKR